jgi:hypothetical protein
LSRYCPSLSSTISLFDLKLWFAGTPCDSLAVVFATRSHEAAKTISRRYCHAMISMTHLALAMPQRHTNSNL